ncbi:YidC/Oxa1 family membrane protein insertase [Actinomadura barringtoniae]|uniref:Membrane protein insertase YidC n=1 Tax=Actinomadura barringtoniae TaxID=1427535 RepID=A0A939PJL7_9ACTN|nr:YidC/Oxa1 family membrane protein insertase [Actinomadura barringtoniae]MBO2453941.1 YidC/Oxa1 family membrane protein insertase [Actinomadura barringtoniae]
MSVFSTPIAIAYHLVTGLADVLHPFAGGLATVAAIVVFTAIVRLCLVPFAVSQARGERSRAKLLPQMQAIQKKHAKNPQRLQREMAALYEKEGTPLAGCLPTLLQMPFFFVMYRLFMSATIAGHQNALLAHTLLAAPLGQNWISTLGMGFFSPASAVFLGLFALLALVAYVSSRRIKAEGPIGNITKLLPFTTLVMAAFVPLAAAVYLLTTTTWTAIERGVLQRRIVTA